VVVDTSVLARTLQPHHALYPVADRALEILLRAGQELVVFPQNLVELWVVATRPPAANGLGMNPAQASTDLSRLRELFVLLPESPAIYSAWETLVVSHEIVGKSAHDARIVAAMQVHGMRDILTFDRTGFSRYRSIHVLDPYEVVANAPESH
jgi:predicted nucleic acid-binding protein